MVVYQRKCYLFSEILQIFSEKHTKIAVKWSACYENRIVGNASKR